MIIELIAMDPTYVPPPDFKPPKKYRQISIPEATDVFINYVG